VGFVSCTTVWCVSVLLIPQNLKLSSGASECYEYIMLYHEKQTSVEILLSVHLLNVKTSCTLKYGHELCAGSKSKKRRYFDYQ